MLQHPWQGKTVAYFGDSLTDPNQQQPKHDWTGIQNFQYWGYLQQWLGIKPLVYAVSGSKWDNIPHQARELKEEHGDNFDAITIFMGTNDFYAGIPIGTWYDETTEKVIEADGQPAQTYERKMRTLVMSNKTFRGRINIALGLLKKMFPTKQIVIFTPLHRAFATFGPENIQPTEAYKNRVGEYFDAYVKSVKEAGNVWSVPVIDLNAASGLNPMVSQQLLYFGNVKTDQLHPNYIGHRRLARTLMYQLSTIPCNFE